jgi:hypothetical protein
VDAFVGLAISLNWLEVNSSILIVFVRYYLFRFMLSTITLNCENQFLPAILPNCTIKNS